MQKLVLETPLLSQLDHVDRQLELCNGAGQTIGYFVPVVQHGADLYVWAEAQISADELDRPKHEPDGRSTTEVLERLGGK
ncbi:MAG TPA: hypothetical protein VG056_05635 [Pirellulales bacterium]|nr:hypothetical protein [Pirellulales bacterium]